MTNIKILKRLVILSGLTLTCVTAFARPVYVSRVPTRLDCLTCHIEGQPKSVRNAFGFAFLQAGLSWSSICDVDSDLDGFSNGVELNDPDCTWVRGAPLPMEPQSYPGDPSSTPEGQQPPEVTCDDLILNGDESDVDCGGPDCPVCGLMSRCAVDMDCESERCVDELCQEREEGGESTVAGEAGGVESGVVGGEMGGEMGGEIGGEIGGEPAISGGAVSEFSGESAGEMSEPSVAGDVAGDVAGEMTSDPLNSTSAQDGGCVTKTSPASTLGALWFMSLLFRARRRRALRL